MSSAAPPIQNAFTVDVEDYFQVSAFEHVVARASWDTRPSRVVENTLRILNLLADANVRGTFFVLGWVAERQPDLVREIQLRGHEIACHGYSHSLIYNQSRDEFRSETRRAKDILENIISTPVSGYRAASYSITRKSLWALDVLTECGFSYDSSIFPIRHDRYGIPGAPRFMHVAVSPRGSRIVEIPMSTFQLGGLTVPVGGGGYFRLFPYPVTRYGMSRINRADRQPFVFYMHPWEIDGSQPRIQAGLVSSFRHYTNIDTCETKLCAMLRQYTFAPLQTMVEQRRSALNEHIYSDAPETGR